MRTLASLHKLCCEPRCTLLPTDPALAEGSAEGSGNEGKAAGAIRLDAVSQVGPGRCRTQPGQTCEASSPPGPWAAATTPFPAQHSEPGSPCAPRGPRPPRCGPTGLSERLACGAKAKGLGTQHEARIASHLLPRPGGANHARAQRPKQARCARAQSWGCGGREACASALRRVARVESGGDGAGMGVRPPKALQPEAQLDRVACPSYRRRGTSLEGPALPQDGIRDPRPRPSKVCPTRCT
jgi:hypothetical protein